MARYKIEQIENKKEWESFVLSRNPHTFLQSWHWGEVEKSQGNKIFRWGIKGDNKLVGICLIIEFIAKRGSYLLVPAGPILDWENEDLVKFFIGKLRSLAQKENVWFIRLRPELKDSISWRRKFGQWGFISSPMHVHAENTWILDIDKSDDELLSGMRKSTRYLVRKSLKSGLKVVVDTSPKNAKLLYKLQEETAQRHKFVGFSESLFYNEITYFAKDDHAAVFSCYVKKRPLASAIIIFYGNSAYYHYSGSVSGYNTLPFSYYMQWQIIQEAKKRKLKYYNFWGIAPNEDPGHRFAGVTLFKTGFGGERFDWLHAVDLPIKPYYWLTFIFETFRHIYRRL